MPESTPERRAEAEVSAVEDPGTETAAPSDEQRDPQQPTGRTSTARRAKAVQRSWLAPSRGQVVVGLVLCLVALGVTVQLRSQSTDETYATARRADLVQILDGLNAESRRLDEEISSLESTRDDLRSGVDSEELARTEALRRQDELGILAGTLPATGPGVRIVIDDPNDSLTDAIMIDTIQELRDSGAEAIELNDSVRVVASTWFGQDDQGLLVDGQQIEQPYVIDAIGDPNALTESTRFPGGLVSEVNSEQVRGDVTVDQPRRVTIDSLHTVRENQYARPAR